jgi:hypothetical protein
MVAMKSSIVWDITLCSPLNINYPLPASAGFLLGFFFEHENGGNIFLQNLG